MSDAETPEQKAERLFRRKEELTKALADYRAKEEARRLLTAKLRAERLAREAVTGKPKIAGSKTR
jgi:hypothetical protein